MCCNCTKPVLSRDVELISNQAVVAEKTSCFKEIDEGNVLLLKVTNNFDEAIFIPLSDSRSSHWYIPETVKYLSKGENYDTLFTGSRLTTTSFSERKDTLRSGETNFYCLDAHYVQESARAFDFAQLEFPFFTGTMTKKAYFLVLIEIKSNELDVEQKEGTIPMNAKKGDKISIDNNIQAVIY